MLLKLGKTFFVLLTSGIFFLILRVISPFPPFYTMFLSLLFGGGLAWVADELEKHERQAERMKRHHRDSFASNIIREQMSQMSRDNLKTLKKTEPASIYVDECDHEPWKSEGNYIFCLECGGVI